jgi:hypothetical protein
VSSQLERDATWWYALRAVVEDAAVDDLEPGLNAP